MVLNWNFGVEQALTNTLTLDVDYVGNHGQHLFDFRDINQPVPGPSGTAAENARRPYTLNGQFPWFAQMRVLGDISNISNYDALQIIAKKRAGHGLTFIATYTFSHALDENSSDLGMLPPQDARNPGAEYGNASFDIRHRVTFGPSYFLPGKAGFGQMLQGWQLTSTVSVFSHRPINPTDAADDLSGTGEAQDRWTLAGDPHDFRNFGGPTAIPCYVSPTASGAFAQKVNGTNICTVGLPTACLNAAAAEQTGPGGTTGTASLLKFGCYMMGSSVIVPPAQGTFGTMSRYDIYGLGFWEWDMSIIKSWRLKEKLTAQFRAEIYNVTNTTQYFTPVATLSTPSTFGQAQATPEVGVNSPIVGTGGPRKFQFGLKFLF
jgi:hypothetical protein